MGWIPAFALLIGLWGCDASERPSRPRHVVLITLDSTRIEMLSSYGGPGRTPHLDALARDMVRFEQAVTTAPYTGPSHASMLTGLDPPRHGLRDFLDQALPKETLTLAEILYAHGFQTAAFVSTYVLDPLYGFDQGFDVYSSPVRKPNGKPRLRRPGSSTLDDAIRWLTTRDPERPFFLWLHLYDAHGAMVGPIANTYRAPPRMQRPLASGVDPSSAEAVRQRYYEQAGLLDEGVERLLAALRAEGLYDETTIAITSDHGELLGAHGRRLTGHSPMLVDATLRVPLLLRVPGRTSPGLISEQVSVVDLAPTFLEALGLAMPAGLDGESLLGIGAGPPRVAYSETFYEHFPSQARPGEELASLRVAGWKLLVRRDTAELFDLENDPDELRNVADENPEQRDRLLALLAARRKGWPETASPASLEMSDDARREHEDQLRALGYVE